MTTPKQLTSEQVGEHQRATIVKALAESIGKKKVDLGLAEIAADPASAYDELVKAQKITRDAEDIADAATSVKEHLAEMVALAKTAATDRDAATTMIQKAQVTLGDAAEVDRAALARRDQAEAIEDRNKAALAEIQRRMNELSKAEALAKAKVQQLADTEAWIEALVTASVDRELAKRA